MNGIKGTVNTLNQRRGREDALHAAIDMARIDRPTLEAMLGAMQRLLPHLPPLLQGQGQAAGQGKAGLVGCVRPGGHSRQDLHLGRSARLHPGRTSASFSPELAAFAKRAFDEQLDRRRTARRQARRRVLHGRAGGEGKPRAVQLRRHARPGLHHRARAGARLPQRVRLPGRQDRAAAGHAHDPGRDRLDHVRDHRHARPCSSRPATRRRSLPSWRPRSDRRRAGHRGHLLALPVREGSLRAPRRGRTLAPTTCARSWNAPRRPPTATGWTSATCTSTCGPGSRTTTPPGCSFYNFPYAFGLLFGTGLYAIYQQRGAAFVPDYMNLLASTGEAHRRRPGRPLRHRHPHAQVLGGQPGGHRAEHRPVLRAVDNLQKSFS